MFVFNEALQEEQLKNQHDQDEVIEIDEDSDEFS
jgi:hypothetical protein